MVFKVRLWLVAGLKDGGRALLMASAEGDVAAVRGAQELPAMAGFDEELLRAARRRRGGGSGARALASPLAPPSGVHAAMGHYAWCMCMCAGMGWEMGNALPCGFVRACVPPYRVWYAGQYSFSAYAAWEAPGLTPPPSEALQLLYRCAPRLCSCCEGCMWGAGRRAAPSQCF